MSEYIEIDTESTDDPDEMRFYSNVMLADAGEEVYDSVEEMEEGSPVAQTLSFVEGIRGLRMDGGKMLITRNPDTPWHIIVADVSAAIRDFFL
ncbi:MAG: NifU N-terminal domain-containing protein [Chloroflexota bacterium]